jgi:Mn-dependent DtxR family transcriptional regulator
VVKEITPSGENYLKTIYYLSKKGGVGVRSVDIADMLNVSKPSVTIAVKNLVICGLVRKDNGSQIYLTQEGKSQAINVISRFELFASFLSDIFGVSQDVAQKDAGQLEHIVSYETTDMIRKYYESYQKMSTEHSPPNIFECLLCGSCMRLCPKNAE